MAVSRLALESAARAFGEVLAARWPDVVWTVEIDERRRAAALNGQREITVDGSPEDEEPTT